MNLLSKVVARLWLIMMVYFFFTHYAAETGVDIYIYIYKLTISQVSS